MKKSMIFISILLLFLFVNTVNAGFFGFGTIECEQFSIDIPSGFSETEGWIDMPEKPQDYVYVGTGVPRNGETHRILEVRDLTLNNSNYRYDNIVVENYTENNLLLQKCHDANNKNYTFTEFDKDGHHYVITITWDNDLEKLNLSNDVDIVKNVIDTIKHK